MELSGRLKRSDVDEIWAAAGMTPENAMAATYDDEQEVIGAWVDDRLEVVFGVNAEDYPDGCAAVWMVSSPALVSHGKSLVKLGKRWLDNMQARHGLLFNFVDARAHITLRWLARMGFQLSPVDSYGVHGMPFVFVSRGK